MPTSALVAALLLAGLAQAQAAPAQPAAEPASGGRLARRYVIEHIRLEGLARTRASEVRRHLALAEGQLLDEQAVVLSRLQLLRLGWFSRVETRVERGSERGLVVLVFDLAERNTLVVSDLVIGSTGPQSIYGGFGLSESNFLGRGLGLSGAFVYGGSPSGRPWDPARFAARVAFLAPEATFLRLPVLFGVSALALRGEEFICTDPDCSLFQGRYGSAPRLRYERFGGELTVGIRPGPFQRILVGYRGEHLEASTLAGEAGNAVGAIPRIREGRSTLSALTASYDRDTRDDLFFPSGGTRLAFSITFGSPKIGGDYEYSRYLLQLESDHALPHGHGLRLLATGGAVMGDAPFFERFYAADYAYFSIGPALGRALELNFSSDSRYDAYLAMVGAEYAIPLWTEGRFFHRGYVALGARFVYSAASANAGRTSLSSTPFSGDVALRLDTPIGSFNLSLGYALDNFL